MSKPKFEIGEELFFIDRREMRDQRGSAAKKLHCMIGGPTKIQSIDITNDKIIYHCDNRERYPEDVLYRTMAQAYKAMQKHLAIYLQRKKELKQKAKLQTVESK